MFFRAMILQFCLNCFESFPALGVNLPPAASYANATKVLACFEKFLKTRFIAIGKSTITLYISFVLEERIIF